jgi:hypothetical protein
MSYHSRTSLPHHSTVQCNIPKQKSKALQRWDDIRYTTEFSTGNIHEVAARSSVTEGLKLPEYISSSWSDLTGQAMAHRTIPIVTQCSFHSIAST